jgi:hypothetical protein
MTREFGETSREIMSATGFYNDNNDNPQKIATIPDGSVRMTIDCCDLNIFSDSAPLVKSARNKSMSRLVVSSGRSSNGTWDSATLNTKFKIIEEQHVEL